MTKDTEKIIKMISQNKSCDEISKMLNISNKQLFIRLAMLRNMGYSFDKQYIDDGQIFYSIANPFVKQESYIYPFRETQKCIRFVAISDMHLGHKKDDLSLINGVYDYCSANRIHIIFNSGDFFEGVYSDRKESSFDFPMDQMSYGLKNYPYCNDILNFMVLGNHDASYCNEHGINIKEVIEARRGDIIPLGYGFGSINFCACLIGMEHKFDKNGVFVPDNIRILLKGHSHKFKVVEQKSGGLTITVPSLSYVVPGNVIANYNVPSFLDIKIEYNDKSITSENIMQYVLIDGKFIKLGEFQYFNQVPIVKQPELSKVLVRK